MGIGQCGDTVSAIPAPLRGRFSMYPTVRLVSRRSPSCEAKTESLAWHCRVGRAVSTDELRKQHLSRCAALTQRDRGADDKLISNGAA